MAGVARCATCGAAMIQNTGKRRRAPAEEAKRKAQAMRPTKMMVPVPEHVRARRPELDLHWYVMIGGPYDGSRAWVEKHFLIGADVVVEH